MNIIAIDPGYDRVGFAVVKKDNENTLLFSNCLQTNKKNTFEERLLEVGLELEKLIQEYHPSVLAIETLYFTNNQKTAFRVSEARGAILYIAKKNNLQIFEYTPLQIKSALTGYGHATKTQISFMVEKILKINLKEKIDDEIDAIACGITCANTIKNIHNKILA